MNENAGFNINKVKQDLADLKGKKDTLLFSIQKDIDVINDYIAKEYHQIGEKAYGLFKQDIDSMKELAEHFASIDKHKMDLESKNKKSAEIAERYDEEISMLERLIPREPVVYAEPVIPSTVPTVAPEPQSKSFCVGCGSAVVPGRDAFCMKCGTKV